MMILIRLSEIFIITGIFRGTLSTITQQIVIFINISSKFFKYTPFRSEKRSYWSISKSRLSRIPPQSVESLRAYARDVFSFTAILEGQFVLRLWMNKPAVNRVCFFTTARRKSSADAVDGTFKGKVSPRLFTSFSSVSSTLILTISSSNFLFLRPAGVLRANNVFLLDSFWDLNVWKFGREKRCRSCFTKATGKWSYFYTTFGTELEMNENRMNMNPVHPCLMLWLARFVNWHENDVLPLWATEYLSS